MKKLLTVMSFPVVTLAVYASMLVWQKGVINPWEPPAPISTQPGLELPASIHFVEVIEVEGPKGDTPQKAALLADSQGRTALLPQQPEFYSRLNPPQRLAVSVLSTWQNDPDAPAIVLEEPTRRFKNLKTGEFQEFSPSNYPASPDWVPVAQ
jgi:hypothetical protein